MDGSPVRGQSETRYARLSEARNLERFRAELVRLVAMELPNTEVFCGLTGVHSVDIFQPPIVAMLKPILKHHRQSKLRQTRDLHPRRQGLRSTWILFGRK